jgi:hypothetical protein
MMHPAMKAGLMKIKGLASKMRLNDMKSKMTEGEGDEHEGPHAVTPGVDNHEESTEVNPEAGSAVPSELKHAPKEQMKRDTPNETSLAEIHKLLGMKKKK